MTREEIIDGLEIYTVGRLNKARVHITVEELQRFIDEIKALEQSPETEQFAKWVATERAWRKEEKYNKEMDEKYGDCTLETDDIKFIWGVKSFDDLSSSNACLYTMNDIDLTYDKQKREYMLGIETAYMFDSYDDECKYLSDCLKAFTKYMDDNGLNKNEPFRLFMSNPCTNMVANSIEELYTNFKIFVNGYLTLQ